MQLDACTKLNQDTIEKLTTTMDMLQTQDKVMDSIEDKLTIVDENNKKS